MVFDSVPCDFDRLMRIACICTRRRVRVSLRMIRREMMEMVADKTSDEFDEMTVQIWLNRWIEDQCDVDEPDELDEQERIAIKEMQKLLNKYHNVMSALKRSRMEHGDCKSGKRYGGVPRACTACMAQRELDEALAGYKGRMVRIA